MNENRKRDFAVEYLFLNFTTDDHSRVDYPEILTDQKGNYIQP